MLTIAEAAELLNVHVNTIRNWIKKNKIKYFRVGQTIRIPKEEVESKIHGG